MTIVSFCRSFEKKSGGFLAQPDRTKGYLADTMTTNFARILLTLLLTGAMASVSAQTPACAGLSGVLEAWCVFDNNSGNTGQDFYFDAYQIDGAAVRDYESSADPTANTAPNGSADISSGCLIGSGNCSTANCNPQVAGSTVTCGPLPSVFWGFWDGDTEYDGNPAGTTWQDDYFWFRMRVNSDASNDDNKTTDEGLDQVHFNVLIDVDEGGTIGLDGIKEYWIDLDGNHNGGSKEDIINVFYDNGPVQQLTAGLTVTTIQFDGCALLTASGTPCFDSHSRVVDPPEADGESWVEWMIPITALTDGTNQVVYPDTPIRFFYSTSNSATDPLQKDFSGRCVEQGNLFGPCDFGSTTPVTLEHVSVKTTGDFTEISWDSSFEANHAGYRVMVWRDNQWSPVSKVLRSDSTAMLESRSYSVKIPAQAGDMFALQEIAVDGEKRIHGPYQQGATVDMGAGPILVPVAELFEARRAAKYGKPLEGVTSLMAFADKAGVQRVTFDEMAAAGLAVAGEKAFHLALTHRGEPVPVYVHNAGKRLQSGDYIEWIAEPQTNLYSSEMGFEISISPADARSIRTAQSTSEIVSGNLSEFTRTDHIENQNQYTFSAPADDPWFDASLLAWGGPESVVKHFATSDGAARSGVSLSLELWGITDWAGFPDHHVQVKLNGEMVADEWFDGLNVKTVTLNDVSLIAGNNTIELIAPGDTGFDYDLMYLDGMSLSYADQMLVRGGQIQFENGSDPVVIGGFGSEDPVLYTRHLDDWVRLPASQVLRSDSFYTGVFSYRDFGQSYATSSSGAYSPRLEPVRGEPTLPSSVTQYLIVSPWKYQRQAERMAALKGRDGLNAQIAYVNDIYRTYGDGTANPEFIQAFIKDLAANNRLKYVLLLGTDTYDYHGYLGSESQSDVPTLYRVTDRYVRFAPSDSSFGDLNDDGVPELAVGRLPARDSYELDAIITKIAAWEPKTQFDSGFVTDEHDGSLRFGVLAQAWADMASAYGSAETTDLNETDLELARQSTVGMFTDKDLITYFGHSGPTKWSFSSLLNVADVNALDNSQFPVVNQLGCWNTYFVEPNYQTLGTQLINNRSGGASLVMGPATLTDAGNEARFQSLLMPLMLTPGVSIGEAVVIAKNALSTEMPWAEDIQLSFTILGDPAQKMLR